MRLQSSAGSTPAAATKHVFSASCAAGDLLGDAVYVSGPEVAGVPPVTKTAIDGTPNADPLKAISIGIIVFKPTATSCIVQTFGPVQGLYTGLSPYTKPRMWVGASSQLVDTVPGNPGTGTRFIHKLAEVVTSDTIFIRVETAIEIYP
jgi:hypothetical protein